MSDISNAQSPVLVKTKWGFYQYVPLPTEVELQEYYEKKYYQQAEGSYELKYSDEETAYLRLRASLVRLKIEQLADSAGKKVLDIGCGEGWLLDEFYKHGYTVEGVDFSRFGLEKFHPHLLPLFTQSNMYEFLKERGDQIEKHDIIVLDNVIEHVVDPVGMLKDIARIMTPQALLIIEAPNDFSPLQEYLLEHEYITKKFWLSYPAHLSYFNKESMTNVLSDNGFTLRAVIADHPIDLQLLNDNSNYIKDPAKGKNTHRYRVRSDNFLARMGIPKLLAYYESLGQMSVGRNLIYFCSVQAS